MDNSTEVVCGHGFGTKQVWVSLGEAVYMPRRLFLNSNAAVDHVALNPTRESHLEFGCNCV